MRVRFFSPEERVAIKTEFQRGGLKAAYAVVPDRSTVGVRQFLTRSGLYTPTPMPRWRMDMEATLVRMWRDGASGASIGRAIGRTPDAVFQHVHDYHERLGITPRKRLQPMTRAQVRIIAASVERMFDTLAERFGRSPGAIKTQVMRYCIMESRHKRNTARIIDLGGMATTTTSGPQRKREAA